MHTLRIFFALISLVTLAACYGARRASNEQTSPADSVAKNTVAEGEKNDLQKGQLNAPYQRVSLQQADQAQPVAQAMDRKLIKDAAPQVIPVFVAGLGNDLPKQVIGNWTGGEKIRIHFGRQLDLSTYLSMKDQARTYVEISRFVMSKIAELGEVDRSMQQTVISKQQEEKTVRLLTVCFLLIASSASRYKTTLRLSRSPCSP